MIVRPVVPLPARRSRRGFTLVELLAVMAILMTLAALGAVAITGQMQRAKKREAYIKMGKVEQAAKQYYVEQNVWPPSVMELVQPTSGGAPILEGGLAAVTDPWNQQFQMSPQTDAAGSDRIVITCTASDGEVLTWPKQ